MSTFEANSRVQMSMSPSIRFAVDKVGSVQNLRNSQSHGLQNRDYAAASTGLADYLSSL